MKRCLLPKAAWVLSFFLFFNFTVYAQEVTVSGKVSAESGEPLSGATVTVKGSSNSTTTKKDGSFQLNVPTANSVLIITYVGYEPSEFTVGSKREFFISLSTAANSLQDVVVVGYGTRKKSDVTGALSRMTAKEIQEKPATNLLQAMQGKLAGVHISSNFKPGELPVLRVRGNRSINASNEPLYVIDGIPMVSALGVTSFSMNDINPNDIASIEILKDASATAIYGSRGANGVVLITTNKGKKGKVSLNYNSTISLDSYKSLTDWMTGGEFVDRWREALINGRGYQTTTNTDLNNAPTVWYPDPFLDRDKMLLAGDPYILESVWMGYEWEQFGVTPKMRPTTAAEQAMGWPAMVPVYNPNNVRSYNWLNDATRQGITQNHQISVSAGTELSRILVSFGYQDQKAVQRDQNFKRYTINLSGDINPVKWFTLGTSIIASMSKQNFGILGPNTSNTGSKDLYSRSADQLVLNQPYNADGSWKRFSPLSSATLSIYNPLIDIDQVVNERKATSVLASIYAEIKFTPWLKYRLNFGPQFRQFRNGSWTGPDATPHLQNRPSTAGQATENHFSWVLENLLYVDKKFGTDHQIGVTLLQSAQKSKRENLGVNVTGTINPLSQWYDLGSNTVGNPAGYGSGYTENQLASFMGRVNYTFRDKYLLTASMRADGASVLAPGHQWHSFPSFALAWKMQEESFIGGVSWIDELKPRIGWGVTGNSAVNPYVWSGPLSRNPYAYGSVAGIGYLPQLAQNSELTWESTTQTNIGLDFGLFNGRLSGSLEWYRQNTEDLLFEKSLPAVSGYVTKWDNIGKTRNSGVEVTLFATPYRKGNFSWNVDLNWSRNKEEVVELLNGKTDMVANRLFIGQPISVYYGLMNNGIWGSTTKDISDMALFNANGTKFVPGTVRVVDVNGDFKIGAEDEVVLGSITPKWTGGITNTLTYKNWNFSFFVYFRWGQTQFGAYPVSSMGGSYTNGRSEDDVWTWEKQDGFWPIPIINNTITNHTRAKQFTNGSFGVVRNISLSYNLPKNFLNKFSMKDLTLNVQVMNPFIFGPGIKWGINPDDDTNWNIISTNTNPLGGTNNNTILPQSFVFGLRAAF
jgi:TonB-linked SusC/RagA family outer membrane protein